MPDWGDAASIQRWIDEQERRKNVESLSDTLRGLKPPQQNNVPTSDRLRGQYNAPPEPPRSDILRDRQMADLQQSARRLNESANKLFGTRSPAPSSSDFSTQLDKLRGMSGAIPKQTDTGQEWRPQWDTNIAIADRLRPAMPSAASQVQLPWAPQQVSGPPMPSLETPQIQASRTMGGDTRTTPTPQAPRPADLYSTQLDQLRRGTDLPQSLQAGLAAQQAAGTLGLIDTTRLATFMANNASQVGEFARLTGQAGLSSLRDRWNQDPTVRQMQEGGAGSVLTPEWLGAVALEGLAKSGALGSFVASSIPAMANQAVNLTENRPDSAGLRPALEKTAKYGQFIVPYDLNEMYATGAGRLGVAIQRWNNTVEDGTFSFGIPSLRKLADEKDAPTPIKVLASYADFLSPRYTLASAMGALEATDSLNAFWRAAPLPGSGALYGLDQDVTIGQAVQAFGEYFSKTTLQPAAQGIFLPGTGNLLDTDKDMSLAELGAGIAKYVTEYGRYMDPDQVDPLVPITQMPFSQIDKLAPIWQMIVNNRPDQYMNDAWNPVTGAVDSTEWARQKFVRGNEIRAAILSASETSPQSYARLIPGLTLLQTSGTKPTETYIADIENQAGMVAHYEQAGWRARQSGDEELAGMFFAAADAERSKTALDYFDDNTNILGELGWGLTLDWMNLPIMEMMGWTPEIMEATRRAKELDAISALPTEQAAKLVDDAFTSGKVAMEEMLKPPTLPGAVAAVQPKTPFLQNVKTTVASLFERTPETKAHWTTDNAFQMFSQVMHGVTDKATARALMGWLAENPGKLVAGLTADEAPDLAGMISKGGKLSYSPTIFLTKEGQNAARVFGAAKEQLLEMATLKGDGAIEDMRAFMGEFDNIIWAHAQRLEGMDPLPFIPLGTETLRVRSAGKKSGNAIIEYMRDGEVIGKTEAMPWAQAKSIKKQYFEVAAAGSTIGAKAGEIGKGIWNAQRAILADVYLHARPAHWVRNATTAMLTLASDGNLSFEAIEDSFGYIGKKTTEAMATPRVLSAITGGERGLGEGVQGMVGAGEHWTRKFWPKLNPYATTMEAGSKVWTGTKQLGGFLNVGENAFYTTAFKKVMQRYWRQSWPEQVQRAANRLLDGGIQGGLANDIVAAITEAGISGGKRDLHDAIEGLIRNNYAPVNLVEAGLHPELFAPETWSKLWKVAQDVDPATMTRQQIEKMVRGAVSGDIDNWMKIIRSSPPQPGRTMFTATDLAKDGALMVDALTAEGVRAGLTKDEARQIAIQATKAYTNDTRALFEQLVQDARAITNPNPQTTQLIGGAMLGVHDIWRQARAEVDALYGLVQQKAITWEEKFRRTQAIYSRVPAKVRAHLDEVRALLPRAQAGEAVGQWDFARTIQEMTEFDAAANEAMRAKGLKLTGPGDVAFKPVIDAGRAYVDNSVTTLQLSFMRFPTTDSLDLVADAMRNIEYIGTHARALQQEYLAQLFDNAISPSQYRDLVNKLWYGMFQEQSAVSLAHSRKILANGFHLSAPHTKAEAAALADDALRNMPPAQAAMEAADDLDGAAGAAGKRVVPKPANLPGAEATDGFFDGQSLRASFVGPDGQPDYRAAHNAMADAAKKQLNAGGEVTLWSDGQPHKIVSVGQDGALVDETALPWSTRQIMDSPPNSTNRLEFSKPKQATIAPKTGNTLPPMDRERTRQAIKDTFGYTDQQVDEHIAMLDARANQYARQTGKNPEDWYKDKIADIRKAGPDEFVHFYQGRPYAEVLADIEQVGLIPARLVAEAVGAGHPEYLDGMIDFIARQRQKFLEGRMTRRDVAKAYAITVGSMKADAVKLDTIMEKYAAAGGTPFDIPEQFWEIGKGGVIKVRPEEAVGAWFSSPMGKRALDAIDQGVFDAEAWADLSKLRSAYGLDTFKLNGMWDEARPGMTRIDLIDQILAARTSDELGKAVKQLNGISTGKEGFIKHFLGFGDTPTIDAQEISYWLSGSGAKRRVGDQALNKLAGEAKDVWSRGTFAETVRDRVTARFDEMRALGVANDVDPNSANHIIHHMVWDKAKGIQTTHAGMYEAMELYQRTGKGARGAVRFLEDGRAIIMAMDSPDISTFLHETGHVFRRDLADIARVDAAAAEDLRRAEAALGVKNGIWTRKHEEAFVRQFETYIAKGKAPTPGLQGMFDRLKDWLTSLWRNLGETRGDKVNRDLAGVFDRLLADTPQNLTMDQADALRQLGREAGIVTANGDSHLINAIAKELRALGVDIPESNYASAIKRIDNLPFERYDKAVEGLRARMARNGQQLEAPLGAKGIRPNVPETAPVAVNPQPEAGPTVAQLDNAPTTTAGPKPEAPAARPEGPAGPAGPAPATERTPGAAAPESGTRPASAGEPGAGRPADSGPRAESGRSGQPPVDATGRPTTQPGAEPAAEPAAAKPKRPAASKPVVTDPGAYEDANGVRYLSFDRLPKPSQFVTSEKVQQTLERTGGKWTWMEHQVDNADRALTAFSKGKGFVIADSTGTGKTYSGALIADLMFDQGAERILLVAPNDGILKQWNDVFKDVGITSQRAKTGFNAKTHKFGQREITVTSYASMRGWDMSMFAGQKWDLVMFDEAHNMKSLMTSGSKQAQAGVDLAAMADHTLYLSATPLESALHYGYMSDALGVHPTFMEAMNRLGVQSRYDDNLQRSVWEGLSPETLVKLHHELAGAGVYARHEMSFKSIFNKSDGQLKQMYTSAIRVPVSSTGADQYRRLNMALDEALDIAGPRAYMQVQAMRVNLGKALMEQDKLPVAIEIARRKLAEGKSVSFFLFRKGGSDFDDLFAKATGKALQNELQTIYSTLKSYGVNIQSPIKTLLDAFPEAVKITGDEAAGGALRQANVDAFMAGKAKVSVVTMAAGGTGLSLHDKLGNFPRVQINLTSPYTAMSMEQVAGRTFRMGSQSNAEMYWMFNDLPLEQNYARRVMTRMQEMGAMVRGDEALASQQDMLEFVFRDAETGAISELPDAMHASKSVLELDQYLTPPWERPDWTPQYAPGYGPNVAPKMPEPAPAPAAPRVTPQPAAPAPAPTSRPAPIPAAPAAPAPSTTPPLPGGEIPASGSGPIGTTRTGQQEMFTSGEDLPIFTGQAVPGGMDAGLAPTSPSATQETLPGVSVAPEFGQQSPAPLIEPPRQETPAPLFETPAPIDEAENLFESRRRLLNLEYQVDMRYQAAADQKRSMLDMWNQAMGHRAPIKDAQGVARPVTVNEALMHFRDTGKVIKWNGIPVDKGQWRDFAEALGVGSDWEDVIKWLDDYDKNNKLLRRLGDARKEAKGLRKTVKTMEDWSTEKILAELEKTDIVPPEFIAAARRDPEFMTKDDILEFVDDVLNQEASSDLLFQQAGKKFDRAWSRKLRDRLQFKMPDLTGMTGDRITDWSELIDWSDGFARKSGNTSAPQMGNGTAQSITDTEAAIRKISEHLANNGRRRNQMTGSQADALRKWGDGLMPSYDRVNVEATKNAEFAANFAMLNFRDRRRIDSIIGTIFPFHFFWSRSAGNWMQRAATNPRMLNTMYELNKAVELENRQSNVPYYMRGTLPIPGTDWRVANPIQYMLPMGMYLGSDFYDPSEAESPAEAAYLAFRKYTPAAMPGIDIAANYLFDHFTPRNGNAPRMQQYQAIDWMPAGKIAGLAYQAITGNPAPTGFWSWDDQYSTGRIGKQIALDVMGGKTDPQLGMWGLENLYQYANGVGKLPEDPGQSDALVQGAARTVGTNRLASSIGSYLAFPVYHLTAEERKARAMREGRRAEAFQPDQPWGSRAAVEAFDQGTYRSPFTGNTMQTGNAGALKVYSAYSQLYPSTQADEGVRPGIIAAAAEKRGETGPVYAAMKAAKDQAIADNPNISRQELADITGPYWDQLDEIRSRYPSLGGGYEPKPPYGANPQERAEWELRNLIEMSKPPGRPTWPGDDASAEDRQMYYDSLAIWKEKHYENLNDAIAGQGERWEDSAVKGAWRNEFGILTKGQDAADLVHEWDDMFFASAAEKRWDAYMSRYSEWKAEQFEANRQNVILEMGEGAADLVQQYLDTEKGDARAEFKAAHPELDKALMISFNPAEYQVAKELFGTRVDDYFASLPDKPQWPGDDATQAELDANRKAWSAFHDANPYYEEVNLWLRGRSSLNTEVPEGAKVSYYDFGHDWREAKELFGNDIFDVMRQVSAADSYSGWLSSHPDRRADVIGYGEWKKVREQAALVEEMGPQPVDFAQPGQPNIPASFIPGQAPTVPQQPEPTGTYRLPGTPGATGAAPRPEQMQQISRPAGTPTGDGQPGPVDATAWAMQNQSYAQWEGRKSAVAAKFGQETRGVYERYLAASPAARQKLREDNPILRAVSMYTYHPEEYAKATELFGDAWGDWVNAPKWDGTQASSDARSEYWRTHPNARELHVWLYGRYKGKSEPTNDETFQYDFGKDWEYAKGAFGDDIWRVYIAYNSGWDKAAKRNYFDAHPTLTDFFAWWNQDQEQRQQAPYFSPWAGYPFSRGGGGGGGGSSSGGSGGGGGGGGGGGRDYTRPVYPPNIRVEELSRELQMAAPQIRPWQPAWSKGNTQTLRTPTIKRWRPDW